MNPEKIMKVQGLTQKSQTITSKGKTRRFGPYWYGWYMEDGKQKWVYIGKELPKHLEWMLRERFKLPGRQLWSWPAPKKVKAGS